MERDPEHPRAELKPGALAEGVPALLPARGWGGGGVSLHPFPSACHRGPPGKRSHPHREMGDHSRRAGACVSPHPALVPLFKKSLSPSPPPPHF